VADLDHPLAMAALQEVIELHSFFEGWLGGTAPDTEPVFARLEKALAEGFTMVTPDGRLLGRPEVTSWLRRAHGSKGGPAPFRIAIADPALLFVRPPLVALGYVEEQSAAGTVTRRRSTAFFEAIPVDPGRVQWLALHETWIHSAP
jgi:hypothetical protein